VPFTGLGLGLETVADPGNLGTIIRTAAAAGATGWLSGDSVDLDRRCCVPQLGVVPVADGG